jgi:hypothetical protein
VEHIRPHLDITLALLTALVALYFRAPADKRAAFEKANPRIASIIGIVAGIVPFLPMIASGVKGVITGQHPSATGTQHSSDVPVAPWSETPEAPQNTTEQP